MTAALPTPKREYREHVRGPFAENLQTLLRLRRMTASDLADYLGADRRRTRRLVAGEFDPDYAEIPTIARALSVRPEVLAWCPPCDLAARVAR